MASIDCEIKLSLEEVVMNRVKDMGALINEQAKVLEDEKQRTEYNIGLYNGLTLAVGVLTGTEPKLWEEEHAK